MINLENISSIYLQSDGTTVDVTNLVREINLYQNIYEPCITGNILLIDSASSRLSNMFKETIVGKGEQITFQLKTATKPVNGGDSELIIKDYYIYKSSITPLLGGVSSNNNSQAIVFYFSSKIFFMDQFRKIKKSYNDKISNIVKNIGFNYLGIQIDDNNIEETDKKQKIIIPILSPFEAITYLSARAYSSYDKISEQGSSAKDKLLSAFTSFTPKFKIKTIDKIKNNDYVFYEDLNHNYYFKSIGSMYLKDPVVGAESNDSGITLSIRSNGHINKITSSWAAIQIASKTLNPLENVRHGMYASTLLTFDLTRKKYGKTTIKYKDLFKTQNHFYKNQLINPELDKEFNVLNEVYDHTESSIKYHPKSTYLYSEKGINESPVNASTPVNDVNNWLLQRVASMEALNQEGLDIELRGNVSLNIGDVVKFKKQDYNVTTTKFSKEYDNLFNGKYLITKIKHTIENGSGGLKGFNIRTFIALRRDSNYGGEE